jgi:hypothetical protein
MTFRENLKKRNKEKSSCDAGIKFDDSDLIKMFECLSESTKIFYIQYHRITATIHKNS